MTEAQIARHLRFLIILTLITPLVDAALSHAFAH